MEVTAEENQKRKARNEKPLTKAEVEDVIGINPWKDARVSTVPLDFAVGLANRGKIKGAYFRVAPDEDNVQDALKVDTTKDDLPEGKVPLFYFEDFEVDLEEGEELWSNSATSERKKKIPLCFSRRQLIQEWKERNPKADLPEVKVTELFSILTSFVEAEESDDDLEKLVLLAPPESAGKVKICEKKGGKEQPFKLGERLVIL